MGHQSSMTDLGPAESSFHLSDADRWVLSLTDEEYTAHDWDNLKKIIESNDLGVLKRKPSDLRRYIHWSAETKAKYGTVTDFILQNRLPTSWGQPPFTPESQIPFDNALDYKVLLNDWPYGLAPGITHIVVWSRTLIPTDSGKGDLTPGSRSLVEAFVQRYFVDALLGPGKSDQVLWFKNWVSLQSVRTLEHFHVLVRDVDDETLERWTGERPSRGNQ